MLCLLNKYIDIGTRYMPNMKTCSVYYWNQNRNNTEKWSYWSIRGIEIFICLFIFDYRALFVCLKDRTRLKIAIPTYCFNIRCLVLFTWQKVNMSTLGVEMSFVCKSFRTRSDFWFIIIIPWGFKKCYCPCFVRG